MNTQSDSLSTKPIGGTYTITAINSNDGEMERFLFTLGCYVGEQITIISRLSDTLVVAVKDARYSIDSMLAGVIMVD